MKYALFVLMVASSAALADQYVNPYYRQDGTLVQGHMRSSPNSSAYDNYSTQGNTNPYTGQRGSSQPAPSYGNVYSAPNPSSYITAPGGSYRYGR